MRAKLFSTLWHALIAAAAISALTLSVIAIVKLRADRSVGIKNTAGDCTQDLDQRQRGGNQSAI